MDEYSWRHLFICDFYCWSSDHSCHKLGCCSLQWTFYHCKPCHCFCTVIVDYDQGGFSETDAIDSEWPKLTRTRDPVFKHLVQLLKKVISIDFRVVSEDWRITQYIIDNFAIYIHDTYGSDSRDGNLLDHPHNMVIWKVLMMMTILPNLWNYKQIKSSSSLTVVNNSWIIQHDFFRNFLHGPPSQTPYMTI